MKNISASLVVLSSILLLIGCVSGSTNTGDVILTFSMAQDDVAIVHVDHLMTMTVSLSKPLDAGETVSMEWSYTGDAGAVIFTPNQLTFRPEGDEQYVAINGLRPSSGLIQATFLTVAARFNVSSTSAMLRVLPLIAVSLRYDPLTQPIVVGHDLVLPLMMDSPRTSLIGPIAVYLEFESNGTAAAHVDPDRLVFQMDSSANSLPSFVVTGVTAGTGGKLTLVLTGPSETSYKVATPSWLVDVVEPATVTVSSASVYAGSDVVVTVTVSRVPDKAGQAVTIGCTVGSVTLPAMTFTHSEGLTTTNVTLAAPPLQSGSDVGCTVSGSGSGIYPSTVTGPSVSVFPLKKIEVTLKVESESTWVYIGHLMVLTAVLVTLFARRLWRRHR